MNIAVDYVGKHLTAYGLRYNVVGEQQNAIGIGVGGLPHIGQINTIMIFSESGTDVTIRVWNICKAEDETDLRKLYEACNKLNREYRWIKFYVDEERSSVTAEYDAAFEVEQAGNICFSLLHRISQTVDEAYPELMRFLQA